MPVLFEQNRKTLPQIYAIACKYDGPLFKLKNTITNFYILDAYWSKGHFLDEEDEENTFYNAWGAFDEIFDIASRYSNYFDELKPYI